MRVYEIAKIVGVPSKDVRMYLEYIGQPVKSSSSKVEDMFGEIVANRMKATYTEQFAPYWATPPF